MQVTYEKLTPEQQQAYVAQLARVGLTLADVDMTPRSTADLSEAGLESVGISRTVEVKGIAELKELAGHRDEDYYSGLRSDQNVAYPAVLSHAPSDLSLSQAASELRETLTYDDLMTIRKAAGAYVFGDSAKVKDFEPLINQLMFPLTLEVVAAGPVTVEPGKPLVLSKPGVHTYTSITVAKGGEIIVTAPVTVRAQVFTTAVPPKP